MTNCETFYDADPECGNMFPPLCGVGSTCGKPRLSSLSWQQLESWRRWSKLAELNGAKTDRTALGRIKATGNRIPGGIADAAGPARHVDENRSVDATTLTNVQQSGTDRLTRQMPVLRLSGVLASS
jgi:hypothetical protein